MGDDRRIVSNGRSRGCMDALPPRNRAVPRTNRHCCTNTMNHSAGARGKHEFIFRKVYSHFSFIERTAQFVTPLLAKLRVIPSGLGRTTNGGRITVQKRLPSPPGRLDMGPHPSGTRAACTSLVRLLSHMSIDGPDRCLKDTGIGRSPCRCK